MDIDIPVKACSYTNCCYNLNAKVAKEAKKREDFLLLLGCVFKSYAPKF